MLCNGLGQFLQGALLHNIHNQYMQIDKIYFSTQLFNHDDTLTPWQSPQQIHITPFMTSLEQQYTSPTFNKSSLFPGRSKQVYKQKQKSKGNLFQAVKLKGQGLSRWNSVTNPKVKAKTPLLSHSAGRWKNEQKKYNFNEVLIHASTIMNKTSFVPLHIAKMDNFSSLRSASARYPRNKNAARIELKGASWPQKSPQKMSSQQSAAVAGKAKASVSGKQVLNKQWERSNSVRSNLNRYVNNYMRQQVKLKPVCLKLKFNK